MADLLTAELSGAASEDRACDAFWDEVANLGVREFVRMADGSDYVAKTPAGRYVRVPDPRRCRAEERVSALVVLSAHCWKWFN